MGAKTAAEYHRIALRTIETGTRFTFLRTGVARIGFYDRRTHCFVVIGEESGHILSASRQSENHVRTLAGSTYDSERARGGR